MHGELQQTAWVAGESGTAERGLHRVDQSVPAGLERGGRRGGGLAKSGREADDGEQVLGLLLWGKGERAECGEDGGPGVHDGELREGLWTRAVGRTDEGDGRAGKGAERGVVDTAAAVESDEERERNRAGLHADQSAVGTGGVEDQLPGTEESGVGGLSQLGAVAVAVGGEEGRQRSASAGEAEGSAGSRQRGCGVVGGFQPLDTEERGRHHRSTVAGVCGGRCCLFYTGKQSGGGGGG